MEVGDGIARCTGLSTPMAGEMVEFSRAEFADWPSTLKRTAVGVVILGDYLKITEGDEVKSTRARCCPCRWVTPLLGRVVDPLGNPLDGKGPDHDRVESRPVEHEAVGVAGRQPVKQPLQTGIKAIDSMTPIGRGQRELIIGDRKTGKTAVAIDTIHQPKGHRT